MGDVSPQNRLNELTAQDWLRFTKTWFVHNPKRRSKSEMLHPAKYPEDMIEEFISFFTKPGQVVFDPFLGTGSTLVAAHRAGRQGIGIELQKKYADIALSRLKVLAEQTTLTGEHVKMNQQVVLGNSSQIDLLWKENEFGLIDLVMTSPPYGPMLKKKGLASSKREEKGLDTQYSEDTADIGNAVGYDDFMNKLVDIFVQIKDKVKVGGHLVVVLQNYMEKGNYQMLAWDFAREMAKHYQFRGERIWCQDNKTLFPYGYKYSFVPNVHHHYCLVFKKLENNIK
ncbi:MAG: hypothetical protein CMH61_01960 [Nanoarchaeota archaeon]|nr:hypothetical protein [Nanoarchaeota archaeon]|tara:strand:- start:2976 stop:3824 length:849 start_codon:yes stop_codon:yes gene_type:complete